MFRKPQYIILGLVVGLVVVVLNLPQETAARFKLAIGSLFLPLFGISSASQNLAGKAGNAVVPRAELLRELDQIHKENEQLKFQARQSAEILRENEQLRRQVGFAQNTPWKLKAVRVVGRDPANWWRSLHVDAGSRDGLRVDLPVITTDGLVGRVATVALTRSQVLLVGDPKCGVSALVQDTRDQGVLVPGAVGLDHTITTLTYLPRSSTIKAGQTVLTSGVGGVFPKGIVIGTVIDTRPAATDLYTEARVKLAVDSGKLENAWVILLP